MNLSKLCVKLLCLTAFLILVLRFCMAMANSKKRLEWYVTKRYPAYIFILTALIFLSGAATAVTFFITLFTW